MRLPNPETYPMPRLVVTEVRNDTRTESRYAKRKDKGVLCWELLSEQTSVMEKKKPKKTNQSGRALWGSTFEERRAGAANHPAQGCACRACVQARLEIGRHPGVHPSHARQENARRSVFHGLSYDAAYIDEASVVPPIADENPPEVDRDQWQSVMNRLSYSEPRVFYGLRGVFDID